MQDGHIRIRYLGCPLGPRRRCCSTCLPWEYSCSLGVRISSFRTWLDLLPCWTAQSAKSFGFLGFRFWCAAAFRFVLGRCSLVGKDYGQFQEDQGLRRRAWVSE